MLAEAVVVIVVVVVEVEFGTVGIETSVSCGNSYCYIVAEFYAFFAARAAVSSETFWPRLPITLQGTQFKATVE